MRKNLFHFWLFIIVFTAVTSAFAQSSDQLFPTPVRTTEITSSIKARAIGDPRLTTYYYTFEGRQGDVFINVQSKNFTGDIDVYVMPGQVPMTKIVVYGDQPETETGRVIYLRKPERLLLRVQGRSPGDEDASVRIKFAGSFAASQLDDSGAPDVPKVESTAETTVRVNSVGTILEVIPKATPTPAAVAERSDEVVADEPKSDAKIEEEKDAAKKEEAAATEPVTVSRRVEVLVTDPVKPEETAKKTSPRRTTARNRRTRPASTPKTEEKAVEEPAAEKAADSPPPRTTTRSSRRRTAAAKPPEEPQSDPMANIRLVVYFKDGSTIDRPMNEVLRFSVERAVLTVISKNGTIGRYNMSEVARVSIE